MNLDEQTLDQVAQCARVGFSLRETCQALELPFDAVASDFELEQGPVYTAYTRGRLQAELELRQSVLASALNGSTPMLQKMLDFFRRADNENGDCSWGGVICSDKLTNFFRAYA